MWKRNIILISSVFTILIFILIVGIVELTFIGKGYSEILKANWDINLPAGYELVYEKDSGPSFLGDGERYHIFRYEHAERVNHYIGWYKGNSAVLESEAGEVLKALDIPEDMLPDFTKEYKYYMKRDKDSSKLYLIFYEDSKEVYIIENIF